MDDLFHWNSFYFERKEFVRMAMEIQSPFRVIFDHVSENISFADYLFGKFQKFNKALAFVDSDTKRQWRFCDIQPTVSITLRDLRNKAGVNANSRIAVAAVNCPEVLLLQMACGTLGIPCINVFGDGTIDEILYQLDLSEASHAFTESQFFSKLEEVKKKGVAARGSFAKLKFIGTLSEYVREAPKEKQLSKPDEATARLTSKRTPSPGTTTPRPGTEGGRKPAPLGRQGSRSSGIGTMPELTHSAAMSPASSVMMMGEENEMEDYPPESQPESDRMGTIHRAYNIFFSSGTTGLPKAVEISNYNLIINMQQLSAQYLRPPKRNEKFLAQLPFHHVYGTLTTYLAIYNGATVITLAKYKPDAYLDLIMEYKITCLHTVPPIIHMLATYPGVDSRDLSSLQTITCAAAPLNPLIAQKAAERLKIKDMRQLFGMTEILVATWSHVSCPKIDSVGVPLPGVSCKIVHTDKRFLLEAGAMGELCVKGPQISMFGEVTVKHPTIMPRYYKNPKATGELLDKDGYIKTGDLAYYDSEGFIYIVDRLKDIIKYKGAQVSPTETEILIRTYPGVADVAVVGRPEQTAGEVPAAFIVKADDYPNLTAVEIREHVKEMKQMERIVVAKRLMERPSPYYPTTE